LEHPFGDWLDAHGAMPIEQFFECIAEVVGRV
jgi:hypothetical protein